MTNVEDAMANALRGALPGVISVYLFGSRAEGRAAPDSDFDLAVLAERALDPVSLWTVAGSLAEIGGSDVDLVDLRAASTVMRYQVISRGRRIWRRDQDADLFEYMALSSYWDWNITRQTLVEGVRSRGSVYGG